MNFTIMIPTRNRPHYLFNAIRSINATTQELDKVEVSITYDEDDLMTRDSLENLTNTYNNGVKLNIYRIPRSYNISEDYFNMMARNSSGKYLIATNDDICFKNYAWDTTSVQVLDRYKEIYPDGVLYGVVDDKEVEKTRKKQFWFSCFPLISREAVNALGFFFDPEIWKDGADWDIFGIYKEIARVVDLRPYLVIEHISTRSGRREKDQLDIENHHITSNLIPKVNAGTNNNKYSKFLKDYIRQYGSPKYNGLSAKQLDIEGRLELYVEPPTQTDP